MNQQAEEQARKQEAWWTPEHDALLDALVEDAVTTEWPVGPVTRQMILDFRASVTEASKIRQTLRERETGLLERRPWPARVAHSQTT